MGPYMNGHEPKPESFELAQRTPLPASTSTVFLPLDADNERPQNSSSPEPDDHDSLPPVDRGFKAWSFV